MLEEHWESSNHCQRSDIWLLKFSESFDFDFELDLILTEIIWL